MQKIAIIKISPKILINFSVLLLGTNLAPSTFSCCHFASLRYNFGLRKQTNPIVTKQTFKITKQNMSTIVIIQTIKINKYIKERKSNYF